MRFDIINGGHKIHKKEFMQLITCEGNLFELYNLAKEKDMFIQVELDERSMIKLVKIFLKNGLVISGSYFVISDNEIQFIDI